MSLMSEPYLQIHVGDFKSPSLTITKGEKTILKGLCHKCLSSNVETHLNRQFGFVICTECQLSRGKTN